MISGIVTQLCEAMVPLEVRGPTGKSLRVDTILDTGDTDALSLLPEDIAYLELPFQGLENVVLANGKVDTLAVHSGSVIWDGLPRVTRVLATEGGALLGMTLLLGHRVIIDVRADGPVTIQALASP